MDNLTHTLVGVLVGETVARTTAADPNGIDAQTRRNIFVTLMAIGSNVPDLDFIPSRLTDSKLDYLLNHRGHTHTIIGAILLGVLLLAACEVWCRWRHQRLSARDRIQFGGIALLAGLLHLALDFTNSYGVHPFWPLDNRWYYGDAVFIVEPAFWAVCSPLVFLLRTKPAKLFVALALVIGVVLSFSTGMVPPVFAGLLVGLTLAMLAIGKLAPPRVALWTSISAWIAINGVFLASSQAAARQARSIASESYPDHVLLDHVLTPLPLNPLCWQLILVQADDSSWQVRRALLSLAPRVLPAQRCPTRSAAEETTAPMTPITLPSTASIAWQDEIATSRSLLAQWVDKDCNAAAFMRFARAPWLARLDARWVLGDARFDHEPGLSFAEIELGNPQARCLRRIPPWTAPLDARMQVVGEKPEE